MIDVTLRPMRVPDDYEAVARLMQTTADDLAQGDRQTPKADLPKVDEHGRICGFYRTRIVAVDLADRVVGYVASWRAPWAVPGTLGSHLVVDPNLRGQGIGTKLWEHLADWSEGLAAHVLYAEIAETDRAAVSFAQQHGFAVDRHLFQSRLELAAGAEVPFAESVERALTGGIRFVTGAAVWETVSQAALYELFALTCRDNPAMLTPPTFDEWQEAVRACPPQYLFLALDGGRPVGLTQQLPLEDGGLYNEYTGVDPAYRGRGIALALKVLLLAEAKRGGVTYLLTDNDAENHPMLAVNRKLGYAAAPGTYRMIKLLRQEVENETMFV
ncbi:acetyltransferase (GNAT) family protein [Tumebacillus sp. BK434]|nr:acetyltransferase (GNAT) family protein [Tumebacillus sp. BK434]